jgi:membrane fusion protein, copper/silver efflux system
MKCLLTISLISILLMPACNNTADSDHSAHKKTEAATAVYTCPMHPEIVQDQPGECPICGMNLTKKDTGAEPGTNIQLTSLLKPTNGFIISTVPVTTMKQEQVVAEIEATGKIEYDTRLTGSISARISGRIEKLYVRYKYQLVKKGQKIMDIYSPELMTAQQNLLFVIKHDAANVSLLQAARQKLLLLGMTQRQIDQVSKIGKPIFAVSVFSNYSGHLHNAGGVVSMNNQQSSAAMSSFSPSTDLLSLKEGMYIQKGQTLFTIYNPARAWAVLSVYADGQSLIKKGQLVKITPETAPAKAFQGRIDFIEPFYREGSRTTSVRVYFNNAGLQLPVGSQVRGLIIAHPETAFWLPKEAVLLLGLQKIVFVKENDGFRARPITTGLTANNQIQIISGLRETDSVAANAQYLTDSESFIKIKE